MTTYYARVEYEYTGGDRTFSIPFSYINEGHIKIYINDVETNNFTFNTESQVYISETLTAGDKITIRRITPVDERLVQFTNTSILNKDNQNLSAQQTFNVVQEIYDRGITQADEQDIKINYAISKAEEAMEKADDAEEFADKAEYEADRAEAYADAAEFGMKWERFTAANWVADDDKYKLTITNLPVVNAIYKGSLKSDIKQVIVDIEETDDNIIITSLDAFDGYALGSANLLGSYIHEQTLPANEWVINHQLGKYPVVTLVDTDNIVMVGTIQYTSLNTVTVTFENEVAGHAYLS